MNIEKIARREPRCWVVLDLESAVLDDTAHKRYQSMERWVPSEEKPIRRGYRRSEDPLTTPRWPFQTITTAAIMVVVESVAGNIEVNRFETFSAPDHNERQVIEGVLKVFDEAPNNAELVTWAGMMHDCPLLTAAMLRHGLTYPSGWRWLGFGGSDPVRHLDLARVLTGNFKMKPVHMAEILAACDIPAKVTVPAFAVAGLIEAGRWDEVIQGCECDVISTTLLLAHWRRLYDPRAEIDVVRDRILRSVEALRGGRGYTEALRAYREAKFKALLQEAARDAERLAPWLDREAA
ncbi:hypothetical protein [Stakelama pacifica]|uniref:Putative 3'-5' exonuclease similar to PolB exonuclease domain n=1 Tax=Stakelama pacifica TaxID=517720 RepID=A0A4R6FC98_9SPHN|nr:hypothetical protein [Stakelama pacifica]TDN77845.1 putative 3'-5' exonuclease similar to PolB exonuclease domain [Stakelama pacifica]GGP00683.1 hypothetical protein GCM10011329_37140 [Stakelama pacifica]